MGTVNCWFLTQVLVTSLVCTRPSLADPTTTSALPSSNQPNYWQILTKVYTDYVNSTGEPIRERWKVIRSVLQEQQNVNQINKQCLDVIQLMVNNPIGDYWIAKMIDSNRFLPTGLLSGTTTELGDFDQCLSIQGQFESKQLVGKYCLATVKIPRTRLFESASAIANRTGQLEPGWIRELVKSWHDNDNYYSLTNAVCFPSICDPTEIRTILKQYYPVLDRLDFDVQYCQSNNEPAEYDLRIWLALAIFCLPWLLIGPGTLLDIRQTPKQTNQAHSSIIAKLLLCFSLPANLQQLSKIDSRNYHQADQVEIVEQNRFQFVHGIRTIASMFLIVTNSVTLVNMLSKSPVSLLARHPTDMLALTSQWSSQPFANGWLVVLIFSMLSGMFTIYNVAQPDRLKYNFFVYSLLRWIRFTPALVGTICLSLILEFLGNGPLFQHDLLWPSLRPCYDEWWQNLLYINNFGNPNEKCQMQTWYLAANMQLTLLAFVLLWLYTKRKQRHLVYQTATTFIILGITIIVSVVGFGIAKIRLYQTLVIEPQNPPDQAVFSLIYFSPQMQAIGFFMGAIIGQTLLDRKHFDISVTTNKLWWLASWLTRVSIPFITYYFVQGPEARASLAEGYGSALLALGLCLVSVVWCLSNGWLIYQCAIDQHNPIGRFLATSWFQPISRLSYCIFLLQPMTVWLNLYQTRHPVSMNNFFDVIRVFSFSVMLTLVLSVILYISFEGPAIRFIKLLKEESKERRIRKSKSGDEPKQQPQQTVPNKTATTNGSDFEISRN